MKLHPNTPTISENNQQLEEAIHYFFEEAENPQDLVNKVMYHIPKAKKEEVIELVICAVCENHNQYMYQLKKYVDRELPHMKQIRETMELLIQAYSAVEDCINLKEVIKEEDLDNKTNTILAMKELDIEPK